MTATIARAPARPAGRRARRLRPLLRAEWTKFRTVRGWVIGMIVAAVLMDLIGLFAAGQSNIGCDSPTARPKPGRPASRRCRPGRAARR